MALEVVIFNFQLRYIFCKTTFYLCFFLTLLSTFSVFRVVGGLLSAYDLSGDKIFLEKAKDIADRLLPAWNSPSGIPYNRINLAHGSAHNFGWTGVICVVHWLF